MRRKITRDYMQNDNLLNSGDVGNRLGKAKGERLINSKDGNRVHLEMYAARQSRSAAITMERFIELCKEVIEEGGKAGQLQVFLIKLRAELGYLYPHITSPGILEKGTGKTEMNEIFRLASAHMNPPFDIGKAINKELLCDAGSGHKCIVGGSANTDELTEEVSNPSAKPADLF
jgi:hypothetical protein